MENKLINEKIILILSGVILAGLFLYLLFTIPDSLVSEMNRQEVLGVMLIELLPFVSVGLIMKGLTRGDEE